jgi:hypothetical protein
MSIYSCRPLAVLVAFAMVAVIGAECTPNECLLESDCSSGMSCVTGKCMADATDASADAMPRKEAAADARKDAPGDGSGDGHDGGSDARRDSHGDSEPASDGARRDTGEADAERARDGASDADEDVRIVRDGATLDAARPVDDARSDAKHD